MAGADVNAALGAIRAVESGSYTAKPRSSGGASGAYQFIKSTWLASGGGQYASEAYLATPAEQDSVAKGKVQAILAANGNDIASVPAVWYLGHIPTPAELDKVPHPEAGNKLTVRQYINNWLAKYGSQGGVGSATDNNPIGAAQELATGAASAVGSAVTGALGSLVSPFIDGLKKLTIVGLAVTLGLGLLALGAYRSVKAPA